MLLLDSHHRLKQSQLKAAAANAPTAIPPETIAWSQFGGLGSTTFVAVCCSRSARPFSNLRVFSASTVKILTCSSNSFLISVNPRFRSLLRLPAQLFRLLLERLRQPSSLPRLDKQNGQDEHQQIEPQNRELSVR